ncbi:MAG: HAD-IIIA family hydrolase [Oxalobacter sp.]|jgi:3-deoxy-D-manno-octulosonate 8-phosphate phosphatase (KDO 8-P phosphatase)|nr:HAD-IIIA family hydrolase [Oxalobacter sp.]
MKRQQLSEKLANIKMVIFDVDGVLTDGKMHYNDDGECFKSFHVRDGLGIRLLKRAGIGTAIISARNTPVTNRRAKDIEIAHIIQGASRKEDALAILLEKTGLTAEECAYIGDDVIDLPAIIRVGVSFAVNNAHPEVIDRVDIITKNNGGDGAVREVCDIILKATGGYTPILESYLK